MKNHALMIHLENAAKGHSAVNGDDVPNIFTAAKSELERLYEIEELVRSVFGPMPHSDQENGFAGPLLTTAKASARRLENGRKLGVAVGVFEDKECQT